MPYKNIIRFFFLILIAPLYFLYLIMKLPARDKERLFRSFSEFLCQFPGKCGEYIRYSFYRLELKECGKDCCISYGTIFSRPSVRLGNDVYIGLYCVIGDVSIGDNTLIASRVSIPSGRHQHSGVDKSTTLDKQENYYQKVSIGNNTWIGEGAIVLADVGNNCIIGAGSVVVENIENDSVAVGNPAKIIKKG